jgi:anti-sigma regulatory factor (Ser/Thr protein kinase)
MSLMSPQSPPVSEALVLTLQNERRFYGLVRLVISGLASQLDLPYEQMDDLQLALENVLARESHLGTEITLRIETNEASIGVWVRPFDERAPEDGQSGQLSLERLLARLVDVVEVVSRDGERWLYLEQRLPAGQAS